MCVKIHFFLFFALAYSYAIHRLKLFLVFYGFALLHEFAHIVIAFFLNIKVIELLMLPVGVCAKYEYIDSRVKEIIIALSGPLFSTLIFVLSPNSIIKNANLLIALLNLIPIYPLDGGRILRGLIDLIFGYKRSILISGSISKMTLLIMSFGGIVLSVYFKNYTLIFLDFYVFSLVKNEVKRDRIRSIINEIIGE